MRFYYLIALATAVVDIKNDLDFSELVQKDDKLPRPDLSIVDKGRRYSQKALDRKVKWFIEHYTKSPT